MRRTITALTALVLTAMLAACGADEPTASAEGTTSPVAAVDVTTKAQEAAGDVVTKATETEPGRVEVETSITDPGGDAGSAEAQQAIAACEAIKALGYEHVSILEADGTTFVLAGHPSYGENCTEV